MNERTESLADMLVEVISPVLIMLVVGSLVCFITEVLYQGDYNFRLQFILCMFVMGTVSIARISMEEGATYASAFAAPLACVTAIGLMRFVEFGGPLAALSPVISIGLMTFIWWCTHQLTVDSTVLDRQQDSTGSGLLSQLGWGVKAETVPPLADVEVKPEVAEAVSDHTAEAAPTDVRPFWEKILAPDGRPHSHGMWALYFSLAAVPIFGIGQFFLATEDIAARRWVFKLLVIYVASALALLLATSFLGLRRYLKKRKLELPLEMAAGWLALGGIMIGILLLIAFVLPRPMPEYSIAQLLPEIRSPQRSSSPVAVGKEGVQDKPQGQAGMGQQQTPGTENSSDKSNSGGNNSGEKSGENSSSSNSDNSQSGSQSNSNDGKQGSQSGEKSSNQSNNSENKNEPDKSNNPDKSGSQSQNSSQSSNQGSSSGQSSGEDENKVPKTPNSNNNQQRPEPNSQKQPNQSNQNQANPERPAETQQASSPPSSPPSNFNPAQTFTNLFGSLADVLNWLGMFIMLAVAIYIGWRYREQILAALKQLQQSWYEFLAKLFGWNTEQSAGSSATAVAAAPPPPPVPFSSYADPFATGDAQRWPLVRLVRHSFAALEAWGRERACVHSEEQTPAEFAQAVADQQPAVAAEVQQLAQLYGQVAYGPGVSGPVALQILQKFWLRLRTAETA